MSLRRLAFLLAVIVLAAFVAGGCGGSSDSNDDEGDGGKRAAPTSSDDDEDDEEEPKPLDYEEKVELGRGLMKTMVSVVKPVDGPLDEDEEEELADAVDEWAEDARDELDGVELELDPYEEGYDGDGEDAKATYCDGDGEDSVEFDTERLTVRWGAKNDEATNAAYYVVTLRPQAEDDRGAYSDTGFLSEVVVDDAGKRDIDFVFTPTLCRTALESELFEGDDPDRPQILDDLNSEEYAEGLALAATSRMEAQLEAGDVPDVLIATEEQRLATAKALFTEYNRVFGGGKLPLPDYAPLDDDADEDDRRACIDDRTKGEMRIGANGDDAIVIDFVTSVSVAELEVDIAEGGDAEVTDTFNGRCTGGEPIDYEAEYEQAADAGDEDAGDDADEDGGDDGEVETISDSSPEAATADEVQQELTQGDGTTFFGDSLDADENLETYVGDALVDVPTEDDGLTGTVTNAQGVMVDNTDGNVLAYTFEDAGRAFGWANGDHEYFRDDDVQAGARVYRAGNVLGIYSAEGADEDATEGFEDFMERVTQLEA